MTYTVIPDIPLANIAGAYSTSSYPAGAVPKNATSGDVAHTTAAATLAATAAKTTYISGFSVIATGATSATVVDVTVTDGTWTLTYPLNVPAVSAAIQLAPLNINFNPSIPASATNTTIVVSCPTLGTGNTNICTNAYGFQL
jgi:hypothetical protein